jgi:hypothetical protein
MHWNAIRYCIGFPPEIWYDVADEEGFLIQDEFPIWSGIEQVPAEEVAKEYKEWMRERWNRPCVVIWDGQNETVTPVTGEAISAVRHMDMSNRPWDNGWSAPQSEDDVMETHPYIFSAYREGPAPSEQGALADKLTRFRIPGNGPSDRSKTGKRFRNPIIINEYGWLWLNRDGTTTTLTDEVYKKVLGENTTVEQRRRYYARTLAALTEYWRCSRICAGVLHFCGLGYSRSPNMKGVPPGQTSDNFINLETLEYEPFFEQYVRDAFSPVGLLIATYDKRYEPGAELDVPVFVINDLYDEWRGDVTLSIDGTDMSVARQVTVPSLGRETADFNIRLPEQPGRYTMVAELELAREKVRNLRDFEIISR